MPPPATDVPAGDPDAGAGGDAGTSGIGRDELRPLDVVLPRREDDPLGFPGYAEKLAASPADGDARAVDVGLLDLGGHEVVVARGRFEVLGGSMGRAHGDAVAAALARARDLRLPFVALTSSGGARMQEGMLSLAQMGRAAEGIRALREAGVPALTHLGDPTTGGVFASYGSLADVLLADPTATVGFAGPRVVEALTGGTVGGDSHTGLAAHAAGLVDGLATRDEARARLAAWVALVHPAVRGGALPDLARDDHTPVVLDAHEAVERSRRDDRPSARDLLRDVFDAHEELSGDRAGAVDRVAVTAVGRLGGRSVVVVGLDRAAIGAHGRRGMPGAAGFRTVRRGLDLARRWGLPVVALVDTPGADPSPASERSGVAQAIAETFVALLDVPGPTLGVITGEGGSGGALALSCSDRLLMQEDAFITVVSPEGAAAILHRDASRASEVIGHLRPTATELVTQGIADRVLPGPTTAGPERAAGALRAALVDELRVLDAMPDRLRRRRHRYGPG